MEDVLPAPRQTFTVKEVANLLGFSTNSIYKFVKERRIQSQRVGRGRFRIPKSEVERLLSHTRHPGHEAEAVVSQPTVIRSEQPATFVVAPTVVSAPDVRGDVIARRQAAGAPSLLDWYVGFTLILTGIAFLLRPRDMLVALGAGALQALAGFLTLAGLTFLWLSVTGVKQRFGIAMRNSAVLLGTVAVAVPYLFVGDWPGVARAAGLVSVAALPLVLPSIAPERLFALLVLLPGLFAGAAALSDPSRFPWDSARPLVETYPFVMGAVWLLFLLGFVMALHRTTERSALRVRGSLFGLLGIVSVAFAVRSLLLGFWDEAAFTLPLGTFAFLMPFQERFHNVSFRRRSTATMVFGWLGVLLLASMVVTRVVHRQLESSYLASTDREAEQGRMLITDTFRRATSTVGGSVANPLLAEALASASVTDLTSFARSAYEAAAGAVSQVVVTDQDGRFLAQYPIGQPRDLEETAMEDAARDAVAGGGESFSGALFRDTAAALPAMALATPVVSPKGEVLGTMAVALDSASLERRLAALQTRKGYGTILVADERGRFLFHSERSRVGGEARGEQELLSAVNGERALGVGTGNDGAEYLKVAVPLRELGWGIVARYPVSRAYELGNPLIALTLFGVFSAVGGSLGMTTRLLRPRHRASIPPQEEEQPHSRQKGPKRR